jgi:hypothetical protein
MMSVGAPLIGGAAGFVFGDVFGATGLVREFTGDVEGALPFSKRIDYNALLAEVPYGVGVAVVSWLGGKVGGGAIGGMVFRTAKWFLLGIMVRLLLAGVLPSRVSPSAVLALPMAVR